MSDPTPRRWPRALLLAGALALVMAAARGVLHAVTFALPVSNDDAIPLLMARALLGGELTTTLWNQPYNGALDAYLLAPLVAALGSHHAFRAYELLAAVALVAVAVLLGRRAAGPRAGALAGLLAAFGTPYMALMTAIGPTPNFLVPLLVALPLLWAWSSRRSLGAAFGAGLVAGLAVWDSALALPPLVGIAAGLLAAGERPPWRAALAMLAGAAAGLAPALAARLVGAQAASTVTALRPRWLWMDGLRDLGRAASGLLGIDVPLVVDGPERAELPALVAGVLAVAIVGLAGAGVRRRTLPLVGWVVALAGAFALSRRTGGDEIRYLYGLTIPVLVLVGAGLARLERRVAIVAGTLALVVPWGLGHQIVVAAWSDPAHAVRVWQVPPLDPVLASLRRAGVHSAYASLQFAGRLTLEADGDVIASQAWNERIPGDPLRYRDEVDLDPGAAWVLSPHLSRGMPRAAGFRALLRTMGGRWHEDVSGDLVVFRAFEPPYDEARPVAPSAWSLHADGAPVGGEAYDRDAATAWTSAGGLAPGRRLTVRLAEPRRLSALVLQVDLEESPLAVPWIVEVDGELVAEGPAPYGLQWVNGAPRAGLQALLAIPLGGRVAREVHVVFQGPGPRLVVREAFLYGPDEPERPRTGQPAAEAALAAARRGDWGAAADRYAEAVRGEPERASYHGNLARARWRAARRSRIDVESLPDGGEELVRRR